MAEKFPTPQERAMQWLLEATEIGGMSRPETALHAYQSGFTAALDLCIEIEAAIGEVRKFIVLPGGYLENIIRIAFNAARRKATEE